MSFLAEIRYDPGYDIANRSLNAVACSNGKNGLITRYGWQTQGEIPSFPAIAAAGSLTWNSTDCGKCIQITNSSHAANVLIVDGADTGFVVSQELMDFFTGGKSIVEGVIDAWVYEFLSPESCGIPVAGTSV